MQTTPGIVRTAGSAGSFFWPGAYGTNWWVAEEALWERIFAVLMAEKRTHQRFQAETIFRIAITQTDIRLRHGANFLDGPSPMVVNYIFIQLTKMCSPQITAATPARCCTMFYIAYEATQSVPPGHARKGSSR